MPDGMPGRVPPSVPAPAGPPVPMPGVGAPPMPVPGVGAPPRPVPCAKPALALPKRSTAAKVTAILRCIITLPELGAMPVATPRYESSTPSVTRPFRRCMELMCRAGAWRAPALARLTIYVTSPPTPAAWGSCKVDCGHAQGENDQAAAENVEDYRIEHFQGNQAFSLPVPLRPYLRPITECLKTVNTAA